jgi:hypothetical protein
MIRETFFRFVDPSQKFSGRPSAMGESPLRLQPEDRQLENQITQGPWVVREISYVDEKNRQVYFLASGRAGKTWIRI